MSRNYYSEINFHITWHTKNSLPLLVPRVAKLVYEEISRRIIEMPYAFIHEIGGIETHVHLSVNVPPTVKPSELIGQLKGGSTRFVNEQSGMSKVLQWQAGYGIVSFGTGDLPWVKRYIQRQAEHHSRHSAEPRLERITHDDDGNPLHA